MRLLNRLLHRHSLEEDFEHDWEQVETHEGHPVGMIVTVAFNHEETERLAKLSIASGETSTQVLKRFVREAEIVHSDDVRNQSH